jgi:NAD(P)-dependent dehydrogenase (short-subunit alcohol dehydrogenase family)
MIEDRSMTGTNNSGRFVGKVALVTGAASGIGRETALRLAAEGAFVCCTDVKEAGLTETLALIGESGGQASTQRLDVTNESDWETAIGEVLAVYSQLDVLVNCAGVSSAVSLVEMTRAEWQRVLAINLDGAMFGTKHAIRAMRKTGGSIVHVSSASAIKPPPGAAAYTVSKAALCMLSKAAAKECIDQNIPVRVNTVCPGGVKTPLWMGVPFFQQLVEKRGSTEAAFDVLGRGVPGGQFSEPADVAGAILFLASDEARFVTGIDFVIDAGYIL